MEYRHLGLTQMETKVSVPMKEYHFVIGNLMTSLIIQARYPKSEEESV